MSLPTVLASEHLEPLKLPEVKRPEQMPSLPAWIALRVDCLKVVQQPDASTGKWTPTVALPANLILRAAERELVERHITALQAMLRPTPENDANIEREMLVTLTKMFWALPGPAQSELSAEALGEAYLEALQDMPVWTVQAAIRKWNRSDCGRDARGEPYNYGWRPAPAHLRAVALSVLNGIRLRTRNLSELLAAKPLVEFDDEHCAAMRKRLAALFSSFKTSPVGKDGSGGAVSAG